MLVMLTNEERERMVELVLDNRYIALVTVSRFLRPEIFVDAAGPSAPRARRMATRDFMSEVKCVLDELCSVPNARIGKLAQKDARKFCLRGNVYYSTEWMARQMATDKSLTVAGQVGLSIYEELQGISQQLYKVTDDPAAALTYPSVAVLARMGARNHQDIADVGEFFRFLGIFMRKKEPYAFRLAEELENDQSMPQERRTAIATNIYEQLSSHFSYGPARRKLQK